MSLDPSIELIEQPTVSGTVMIDLRSYRPDLLKIAYEMAFIWFGNDFIDRPEAEEMGQVLLHGRDLDDSYVWGRYSLCDVRPFAPWNQEKSHLAFAFEHEGRTLIAIRLFTHFAAFVDVGPTDAFGGGHFMRFDYVAGTYETSSLARESRLFRAQKLKATLLSTTGIDLVFALGDESQARASRWSRSVQL